MSSKLDHGALVLLLLCGHTCVARAQEARAQGASSQPERPVLALDDLRLRGVTMAPGPARALKGLLHAKLAGSGAFRMIPEAKVSEGLKALRRQSVAACRDGACAMELGKALAASRVLVPELVRFAKVCMVVLTLYELRTATAELATTEACGCDEGALLAAALRASDALGAAFVQKTAPGAPSSTQPSPNAKVSVFVSSRPGFAPIWLDGERVGKTPKLVAMEKGAQHRIKVGAWPYRPQERTLTPHGWQRLHLRLAQDRDEPMEVATTREWFAFGFSGGWAAGANEPLFGAELRAWQPRWKRLTWTAFEARFAAVTSSDDEPVDLRLDSVLTVGTRVAYPLYWGKHGTHQLQLGLGAGYWRAVFEKSDNTQITRSAFALLPSVDYLFLLGNGGFSIGLGVNLSIPLRSGIGSADAPLALTAGLKFGLSGEATMRAHARGKVMPDKE